MSARNESRRNANEKGLHRCKPLDCLARPAGFEPTTPWFVARYSIQLSYGREAEHYTGRRLRSALRPGYDAP